MVGLPVHVDQLAVEDVQVVGGAGQAVTDAARQVEDHRAALGGEEALVVGGRPDVGGARERAHGEGHVLDHHRRREEQRKGGRARTRTRAAPLLQPLDPPGRTDVEGEQREGERAARDTEDVGPGHEMVGGIEGHGHHHAAHGDERTQGEHEADHEGAPPRRDPQRLLALPRAGAHHQREVLGPERGVAAAEALLQRHRVTVIEAVAFGIDQVARHRVREVLGIEAVELREEHRL